MSQKKLSVIVIILAISGMTLPSLAADGVNDVRDLSPLLKVDLRATSSITSQGNDIGLVATLTNLTREPVAVVPPRLFGYINWQFEPRCGNVIGSTGQSIRENSIGPATLDAVVLKPGESMSRDGTLKQPQLPRCESGGSWVINIDYCQFGIGKVGQLDLLQGCVASNPVIVELRR